MGNPEVYNFLSSTLFFIRASTFYLRMVVPSCFWIVRLKRDKVLKSGPIEIYDKQPDKNLLGPFFNTLIQILCLFGPISGQCSHFMLPKNIPGFLVFLVVRKCRYCPEMG